MINFVFSSVTPKMPVLECMYIKQAIDLLQVDKTSIFLSFILLFVLGCCSSKAVVTCCICLQGLLSDRDEKQLNEEHIARLFIFAVMWSVGALLELDDRLKMELFLRKHSAVKELPAVSGEETMFEFVINSCGQWEHWSKKVSMLGHAKLSQ